MGMYLAKSRQKILLDDFITKVSLFPGPFHICNFLPAGMSTPWSMSVQNCHPIAQKLFPQRLVEVDTVVISVTNE